MSPCPTGRPSLPYANPAGTSVFYSNLTSEMPIDFPSCGFIIDTDRLDLHTTCRVNHVELILAHLIGIGDIKFRYLKSKHPIN